MHSDSPSHGRHVNVSQLIHPGQPLCLSSLYLIILNCNTILRTASESVAGPPGTPAEQRSMPMCSSGWRKVAAAEERSYVHMVTERSRLSNMQTQHCPVTVLSTAIILPGT